MDMIQIRYSLNQAYMDGDTCAGCSSSKREHIADKIYCTGLVSGAVNQTGHAIKFGPEKPRPLGKVPCQIWKNSDRGAYD